MHKKALTHWFLRQIISIEISTWVLEFRALDTYLYYYRHHESNLRHVRTIGTIVFGLSHHDELSMQTGCSQHCREKTEEVLTPSAIVGLTFSLSSMMGLVAVIIIIIIVVYLRGKKGVLVIV